MAPLNAERTRQASMVACLSGLHLMMLTPLLAAPFVFLLRRPAGAGDGGETAMLAD